MAAAALLATPPAGAQPLQLTPPAETARADANAPPAPAAAVPLATTRMPPINSAVSLLRMVFSL